MPSREDARKTADAQVRAENRTSQREQITPRLERGRQIVSVCSVLKKQSWPLRLPVDVRKLLKRIVDPDLVIPDLISANTGLDRGPAEELSNVRLRGHTFKERCQTPLFAAFRPDRVNVDWSEGNAAIGVERDRDGVIAVSVGEQPRVPRPGARPDPNATISRNPTKSGSILDSSRLPQSPDRSETRGINPPKQDAATNANEMINIINRPIDLRRLCHSPKLPAFRRRAVGRIRAHQTI